MKRILKSGYLWIAAAMLLLFALIALALFFFDGSLNIARFENRFGLDLPPGTKAIHSDSNFGGMGDGDGLYIFKLPFDVARQSITLPANAGTWQPLPLPEGIVPRIDSPGYRSSPDYFFAATGAKASKGYWTIIDSEGNPRHEGYNYGGSLYLQDFHLGVIDPAEGLVYYYEFHS